MFMNMTIRIDGSEYSGKHSITRLIGAPPSYVGRDQGVQLTDYIRRKPNSIVLNDEIETASREFVALFLQVFDDGPLTDGQARVVEQPRRDVSPSGPRRASSSWARPAYIPA
ncbi:uncharacterized protein B0H18DRAFT_1120424 [Fomitopsis serialis]|uniref:uncharacterized protein n=1 Tax=Fomitopsis serialis TaxID=139415 RepID=UPI0020078608|nr:uncharacterized protein B0H18DRAFT_1120424 [Neoantrodia serialis]KAH9923319.1 hypothetical protein B0H18DRAFT_1120424 [Neoantrodia serialis]